MRAQLSPMFRLSDALLGAEGDPARAAAALDAATGVAANGFEQLAARPGSRSGVGAGSTAATAQPGSTALLHGPSGGSMQPAPEPRVQLLTPPPPAAEQQQQQQQQPSLPQLQAEAALPAVPTSSGLEEMDSLVANARAAAERAQSAIAGLASPPRHAGSGTSAFSAGALEPAAQGSELQLAASAQAGGLQLAVPADAEALVAHLRRQSEELIRRVQRIRSAS